MTFRQTIKKLLQPAMNHKGIFAILLTRGVFMSLLGPTFAFMIKSIITSLEKGEMNSFVISVIIIGTLMITNISSAYFFRTYQIKFNRGIQKTLYNEYLSLYLGLENTFTEKLGTGQINNIFQKGCDNRTRLVGGFPLEGFSYSLRLIFVLSLMAYYLGWQGFLIVAVVFSISFAIAQRGNKKTGPLKKKLRDYFTLADKDIVKIIMSKGEINQSQKGSYVLEKVSNISKEMEHYEQSLNKLRILSFDIQRGTIIIMQVTLLGIIGYGISQGKYEIGLVALFWMLSNQINSSVEEINNYISNFHTQIIYIQKLRDTFDKAPRMQGLDVGDPFQLKQGRISLERISFSYDSVPVFSDFSLEIAGGTKTALVGQSGGGKSTLIKLIAAHIRPDTGSIIIDGQKLSETKLSDYYRHIGYLTQEPSVFDGTIYENLVYGLGEDRKNSEDRENRAKKIDKTISLSRCEFIHDLPQGLHTEIGERGVRLSGGQKQRLAIAKIMLKNPSIILLDEPTSALDSFNEELVSQALTNLFHGKTVIVVAHRLQTVKNSDRILYIDGGKILEEGTHESLIALGGRYKKMLDLQSGF